MNTPSNEKPSPWWHGLMYSTGALLLVCGLPGTLLFWLSLAFTLPKVGGFSEIFPAASRMIAAEVAIAIILLLLAERISKNRKCHDSSDPPSK